MRRFALGLCLASACGRIAFDDVPRDGTADGAPYQEPAGQLDPTFGSGGTVVTPTGMPSIAFRDLVARTADGYLTIGPHYVNGTSFGLFAFTSGGVLDPTYGAAGIADVGLPTSDFGYAITRLADGRLFLGGDGNAGAGDDFTLGIVSEAGVPDPAFGPSGFRRFDILGAMQPDTSRGVAEIGTTAIACGTADYTVADTHFALVALGLDGIPVPSFGVNGILTADFHPGVADTCEDVLALPNGTMVAAGSTENRALLIAYRLDGTPDPSFAGGNPIEFGTVSADGFALALAPDGDIVVSGVANGKGLVARFAPDGSPRAGFGQAGIVELSVTQALFGVAVQPNNKIVAVGLTPAFDAVVVRLSTDGTLDPTFGSGGMRVISFGSTQSALRAVILTATGEVVAAGYLGAAAPFRGLLVRLD